VVRAVSRWLQDMVRYYDSLEWTITASGLVRTATFPVSAFHGRPLAASIEDFIRKICACAQLDESVVLVAAVYLSRIVEKADGKLPISSCTVHRLLLQAMTVGAKFTLDHPRSNKAMASFAEIPVSKFNQLEVKFLCAIQYDLAVTPSDIAIAEGALRMTTSACEPVLKKAKVLQDNSNQSSSASGVAASNNSKVSEEDHSYPSNSVSRVVTSNNSKVSEEAGVLLVNTSIRMENRMENSMVVEAVNNNYTVCCDSNVSTPDLHNNSTAASPDGWSDVSRCPSVQLRSADWTDESAPKETDLLCSGMPEATKLSTPERLGSYTLVATAAE